MMTITTTTSTASQGICLPPLRGSPGIRTLSSLGKSQVCRLKHLRPKEEGRRVELLHGFNRITGFEPAKHANFAAFQEGFLSRP